MSGYLVAGAPAGHRSARSPGPWPSGTVLYPNDILALAVIQQNIGRRPIVWAATTGRGFAGLGDYVVQRGLGFELLTALPDTTVARPRPPPPGGRAARRPHDRAPGVRDLPLRRPARARAQKASRRTSASVAATLGLPPAQLVYAYGSRGETEPGCDEALDAGGRGSRPIPISGPLWRASGSSLSRADSSRIGSGPGPACNERPNSM